MTTQELDQECRKVAKELTQVRVAEYTQELREWDVEQGIRIGFEMALNLLDSRAQDRTQVGDKYWYTDLFQPFQDLLNPQPTSL